jgi:hypothetical protein
MIFKSPSMLAGPMWKLLPPPLEPQLSVAELEPLMVIAIGDGFSLSVAVPVTVQVDDRGAPGQVPVPVPVPLPWASPVTRMVPVTVFVELRQVSVKL